MRQKQLNTRHFSWSLAASILSIHCSISSCARLRVSEVADPDDPPAGIRVYSPRVYLFVDEKEKRSALAVLPDYRRAYDLSPQTILARQKFKVEMEGGLLSSLTAEQEDSAFPTAFLDFLGRAAKAGAGAAGEAGMAASPASMPGTFGLRSGIYILKDSGRFARLGDSRMINGERSP